VTSCSTLADVCLPPTGDAGRALAGAAGRAPAGDAGRAPAGDAGRALAGDAGRAPAGAAEAAACDDVTAGVASSSLRRRGTDSSS